ncbi:hypothetical protein H7K38_23395 [Mycobacterium alsense]|uniref:Uncharacterized protein n=1 Tax=Mycobacterium alsense TaxID=324058 RepID=A0AA42C1A7_9MYCO|nr:hypothetical protein [Mycobacterium alsense]MCV7381578.1 hypothetical protein [Mycobacterium alsense]
MAFGCTVNPNMLPYPPPSSQTVILPYFPSTIPFDRHDPVEVREPLLAVKLSKDNLPALADFAVRNGRSEVSVSQERSSLWVSGCHFWFGDWVVLEWVDDDGRYAIYRPPTKKEVKKYGLNVRLVETVSAPTAAPQSRVARP